MIRVNVLYPSEPGARFDFAYYTGRHIPMVRERCAPFGLKTVTIDKGMAGLAPGAPAAYTCVVALEFESIEGLQQALGLHGAGIVGDIPNYTDITPAMPC